MSSNRGQAVVFAYADATIQGRGFPLLELRGLDPDAQYKLAFIEGKALSGTPDRASGDWWMHHGISLDLRGDFQAAAFRLDREK